jgi:hypothetical protein
VAVGIRAWKKHRDQSYQFKFTFVEEALQMVQVILTLTHSSLTRSALGYFSYEEIYNGPDTKIYPLKADYRATFHDPEYNQFMVLAILLLVVVVMVPLSFSIGLIVTHRRWPEYLETDGIVYNAFGSLYAKFKPFDRSAFAPHWESVRMIRKMLLNCIVVFVVGSGQQSQACLAVLTIALVMLCLVLPFKEEMVDMNLLEILSLLTISMTITLGSIDSLTEQTATDTGTCSSSSTGLDILLITFNFMLVTFMIGKLTLGKRCQCGKSPDESIEVGESNMSRPSAMIRDEPLPLPVPECGDIELSVMGGRGATPAPASAPDHDPLDEEGPGNAHALDKGDLLLPPDDSGSDDTNSSNCSDLPSAPLRGRLPSTAAPMLDRSDCELPDEELEEAEEEAEENVHEKTNQRRTLKAPSMAAPTLDVSNLPDVPPRSNCELPHVLDQGAGSSGTPSRWLQVSELGFDGGTESQCV